MVDMYFLRTTKKDGKAYGGFQWPLQVGAVVEAPDWKESSECGHGLHGLLDGMGDSSMLSWENDAIWWIVKTDSATNLGGKWKFKQCEVVAFGNRQDVTSKLYQIRATAIHGLVYTGGHMSTLTGGDKSTLTGGFRSTLTGGFRSTLTGGDRSTLKGGDESTLTGGNRSTLIFTKNVEGVERILVAYVGEDGILPYTAYKASYDFKTVVRA